EGDDFQRNARINRRSACVKEFDDFLEQLAINEARPNGHVIDRFLAERYTAIVRLACPNAAYAAYAAVAPVTGDQVGVSFVQASYPLASRAHDRVQNLHRVNAVMVEPRVTLVQR